jgi:hypothetical protein
MMTDNFFADISPSSEPSSLSSVFAGLDVPISAPSGLRELQIQILNEAKLLMPEQAEVEAQLKNLAWFPYRTMTPFDRACEFVRAFEAVMCLRATNLMQTAGCGKRSRYLKAEALQAPWIEKTKPNSKEAKKGIPLKLSPRWKWWMGARRLADLRGYQYEDFVHAAVDATVMRGWPVFQPNNLCDRRLHGGKDFFVEATIPALIFEKYAQTIRWCDEAFFQAAAYTGDPLQHAYFRFIAAELVRLHGRSQRAERAFKAYQKDGRIAVALDFDSLLS